MKAGLASIEDSAVTSVEVRRRGSLDIVNLLAENPGDFDFSQDYRPPVRFASQLRSGHSTIELGVLGRTNSVSSRDQCTVSQILGLEQSARNFRAAPEASCDISRLESVAEGQESPRCGDDTEPEPEFSAEQPSPFSTTLLSNERIESWHHGVPTEFVVDDVDTDSIDQGPNFVDESSTTQITQNPLSASGTGSASGISLNELGKNEARRKRRHRLSGRLRAIANETTAN